MALGSTRAELQLWTVDTDLEGADCEYYGYRQVEKRQAPVNVRPIAEELAQLIIDRSQDGCLKWSADGRVRVLTGQFFQEGSSPKQTVRDRRKRLLKVLEEFLAPHGWNRKLSWWENKEPK
jgi:hypothetical protein